MATSRALAGESPRPKADRISSVKDMDRFCPETPKGVGPIDAARKCHEVLQHECVEGINMVNTHLLTGCLTESADSALRLTTAPNRRGLQR
jgi:hypothetical protein